MSILIVQPSKTKTLYVDIGDLDPEEVSKALRAVDFDGYPVGVVEAKRWFAHEVTDLTALFDIFDPVSSHFVCVVSYEMRRGKILAQPRHVSLRKIRRLPPVLRRAVLRDWATFLHNVAWDSLRPELAVIEQVLAAEVELHV